MLDNGVRAFDCRITTYQKALPVLKPFSYAIFEHLLTVIGIRLYIDQASDKFSDYFRAKLTSSLQKASASVIKGACED